MPEIDFEAEKCKHFWEIQPANGQTSKGVCKYCKEVKEFRNYIESDNFSWGDDWSRLQGIPKEKKYFYS